MRLVEIGWILSNGVRRNPNPARVFLNLSLRDDAVFPERRALAG
jgi:hypothetical protein